MNTQVGQLEVILYVPILCPRHRWDLSVRSVLECPYYLCLKNDDRSIYDTYMDVWSKRCHDVKRKRPYDYFMEQVDGMRRDGGYRSDKAGTEPMRIYKGTRWLLDGHHRAAILCALFGPQTVVPVHESDEELPKDLDQCKNPCED